MHQIKIQCKNNLYFYPFLYLLCKRLNRIIKIIVTMKKYLILVISIMISVVGFGQSNYQEVVYLKSGEIIKGVIIEEIPNKSIKIENSEGVIFEYRMNEIEKFGKEKLPSTVSKTNITKKGSGFIGITFGASIPTGYFSFQTDGMANLGYQLNGIEFGYLFSKHIGVSATVFVAENPIRIDSINPWRYGSLMIGPLFSLKIINKLTLAVKPMIGYSLSTVPDLRDGAEEASAVSYGVGANLRYNLNKHISLLLSSDYYYSEPSFKYYHFSQIITTFSIRVGAAYRL